MPQLAHRSLYVTMAGYYLLTLSFVVNWILDFGFAIIFRGPNLVKHWFVGRIILLIWNYLPFIWSWSLFCWFNKNETRLWLSRIWIDYWFMRHWCCSLLCRRIIQRYEVWIVLLHPFRCPIVPKVSFEMGSNGRIEVKEQSRIKKSKDPSSRQPIPTVSFPVFIISFIISKMFFTTSKSVLPKSNPPSECPRSKKKNSRNIIMAEILDLLDGNLW